MHQLLNENIENYISSEKLNYRIDTIATGLDHPWGLTFLPNKDFI